MDDAVARLADPGAATVLRYPTAGHHVGGLPQLPLTDDALVSTGGDIPGTQTASADLWSRTLDLLTG